jgi:glyoxylase-like metal-dependent hydrolase (beta-lactamase superfamily II)
MSTFRQIPGIYHRKIGAMLVTTLCDGYMAYDTLGIMKDADHAKLAGFLADEARVSPPIVSINAFLVRDGARTILVDCGSGDIMGPTCGRLPELLEQLQIAPDAITDVLLTHVHPDHSNGLTDPASGRKLFPRATVHVHQAEITHWFDDALMAKASERERSRYFEAGRIQLTPYLPDAVSCFEAECEVLPGITALPSPGHPIQPMVKVAVLELLPLLLVPFGQDAVDDHGVVWLPTVHQSVIPHGKEGGDGLDRLGAEITQEGDEATQRVGARTQQAFEFRAMPSDV